MLWNSINGPIKGQLFMPKYKKDSFCCHSLSNMLTNTDTYITSFPKHRRCLVLHKNTPAWNQKRWGRGRQGRLGWNRLFTYLMQVCIVCILWATPTKDTILTVLSSFHSHLGGIFFKKRELKYLLTTMLITFSFCYAYKETIIKSLCQNLIQVKEWKPI